MEMLNDNKFKMFGAKLIVKKQKRYEIESNVKCIASKETFAQIQIYKMKSEEIYLK